MKTVKGLLGGFIIVLAVFFTLKFLLEIPALKLNNKIEFNVNRLEEAIEKNRIQKAIFKGNVIKGRLKGTFQEFEVTIPKGSQEKYSERLYKQDVEVEVENESAGWFGTVLKSFFPFFILIFFFAFLMRQLNPSRNKMLMFGKNRARLFDNHQKRVTFQDVAGIEEAKEELYEIVEFLREPQKFQKLGGKIPKGVLLTGPPGSGKTLLARAIAGEANVPFFSISGSDFVEMFVGVGASRVRDLFEQSKKNAPCIIFIDEIDAIGRHRGSGLGGGHDEREQTLNQLLVEMDGFNTYGSIILIAATNRPDILDPALTRPGRFDRQATIPLPDIRGREGILKVHTRNVPLCEDVDITVLAQGTPGFSGAQLANIVNEATLIAARHNREAVAMVDFEKAKDKVLMGKERHSEIMSEKEKQNTAYHEAGHAVVAHIIPEADPIHKVSIIPRGQTLGITIQLPKEDRNNYSKKYLEAIIAISLAGRLAEEMFLDNCTTGAVSDLEQVSEIARKMVCQWGMSEQLGPITFDKIESQIFLGKEISHRQNYSESTAIVIDKEVKNIIMKAQEHAKKILKENQEAVTRLAEALLNYETLNYNDIIQIIDGNEINKS